MLIPFGKLEKMKIVSFSAPEMAETDRVDEFEAFINPEGYEQEYKIEYNQEQGDGTSPGALKFTRMPPQEMSFDFLFDRTGALPDSPPLPKGVVTDVNHLKKMTYDFNGDIHRPPFLKITWGELSFRCVLLSLKIQYKLFRPDGTPIRAVVTGTFKQFTDEQLRTLEENTSSPDLTHIRVVKAGDTLPLMAYCIYGDSKYYTDVARINRLTSFRQLTPGQELVFPPLEK
jgi:hypothetical protein